MRIKPVADLLVRRRVPTGETAFLWPPLLVHGPFPRSIIVWFFSSLPLVFSRRQSARVDVLSVDPPCQWFFHVLWLVKGKRSALVVIHQLRPGQSNQSRQLVD